MGLLSFRRLIIGGAAAIALAVPSAVLFGAPMASAVDGPVRVVDTVGPGFAATKTATAVCPEDTVLLSPGGRVVDGGGDVILTSIVPDVTNHSVTVTAQLRPLAAPRSWTLLAFAVCNDLPSAPTVVTSALSPNVSVTTPDCPATMKVHGTGFELSMTGGLAFLQRLEASEDLSEVGAAIHRAPAATTSLRVSAVCYPVGEMLQATKRQQTDPLAATFPQTVTVTTAIPNAQFYGVGGRVSGDGTDDITIDGLIPAPAANEARVQVNRVLPLSSPLRLNAAALASVAVDPDDVTASTTEIGTFC